MDTLECISETVQGRLSTLCWVWQEHIIIMDTTRMWLPKVHSGKRTRITLGDHFLTEAFSWVIAGQTFLLQVNWNEQLSFSYPGFGCSLPRTHSCFALIPDSHKFPLCSYWKCYSFKNHFPASPVFLSHQQSLTSACLSILSYFTEHPRVFIMAVNK